MATDINVRLAWDETFPGWAASATGVKQDGNVFTEKTATEGASSDWSPLSTVARVVDTVCRELDSHPDNVREITIVVAGDEWMDAARRSRR